MKQYVEFKSHRRSLKQCTVNGEYIIPVDKNIDLICFVRVKDDWEHIIVEASHVTKGPRIPIWEEMCKVKQIFWEDEDVVVQYHPKDSEYQNKNINALHLWKQVDKEFPHPSIDLV